MAFASLAHLTRRGEVFYFRRAIPKALVGRFGRHEIKVSLQTDHRPTATIRCRDMSNAFERWLERVDGMADLTQDQMNALLRTYFSTKWAVANEISAYASAGPPPGGSVMAGADTGGDFDRLYSANEPMAVVIQGGRIPLAGLVRAKGLTAFAQFGWDHPLACGHPFHVIEGCFNTKGEGPWTIGRHARIVRLDGASARDWPLPDDGLSDFAKFRAETERRLWDFLQKEWDTEG